jgi:hypothetical protein
MLAPHTGQALGVSRLRIDGDDGGAVTPPILEHPSLKKLAEAALGS